MNILSKPDDDGFYWLNMPERYGWEPVEIRDGYLYLIGIRDDFLKDGYHEWIKIEKPTI